MVYQISSESPEFYRRYYRKHFGLFSGHTVYVKDKQIFKLFLWTFFNNDNFRGPTATVTPTLTACLACPASKIHFIGRIFPRRFCKINISDEVDVLTPSVLVIVVSGRCRPGTRFSKNLRKNL